MLTDVLDYYQHAASTQVCWTVYYIRGIRWKPSRHSCLSTITLEGEDFNDFILSIDIHIDMYCYLYLCTLFCLTLILIVIQVY